MPVVVPRGQSAVSVVDCDGNFNLGDGRDDWLLHAVWRPQVSLYAGWAGLHRVLGRRRVWRSSRRLFRLEHRKTVRCRRRVPAREKTFETFEEFRMLSSATMHVMCSSVCRLCSTTCIRLCFLCKLVHFFFHRQLHKDSESSHLFNEVRKQTNIYNTDWWLAV